MKIQVCTGRSCKWKFSEYILKRIEADTKKFDLQNIDAEVCACLWQCKMWPNVILDGKTEHYSDPAKISKLMFEKIQARKNNSNPNSKK